MPYRNAQAAPAPITSSSALDKLARVGHAERERLTAERTRREREEALVKAQREARARQERLHKNLSPLHALLHPVAPSVLMALSLGGMFAMPAYLVGGVVGLTIAMALPYAALIVLLLVAKKQLVTRFGRETAWARERTVPIGGYPAVLACSSLGALELELQHEADRALIRDAFIGAQLIEPTSRAFVDEPEPRARQFTLRLHWQTSARTLGRVHQIAEVLDALHERFGVQSARLLVRS